VPLDAPEYLKEQYVPAFISSANKKMYKSLPKRSEAAKICKNYLPYKCRGEYWLLLFDSFFLSAQAHELPVTNSTFFFLEKTPFQALCNNK